MAYPPPLPGRRKPPPGHRTRKQPVGRGNRTPPPLPSERDDAAVFSEAFRSDRERYGDADFLAAVNVWVDVVSTWVGRSRFEPDAADSDTGDWFVEFVDLSIVVYHDTPYRVWDDFVNSSSKGMFIYHRCKEEGRAYELLRGPQRKVSRGSIEIQEPRRHT